MMPRRSIIVINNSNIMKFPFLGACPTRKFNFIQQKSLTYNYNNNYYNIRNYILLENVFCGLISGLGNRSGVLLLFILIIVCKPAYKSLNTFID